MNTWLSKVVQAVGGGCIAFMMLVVSTTSSQAETYFFHTDHLGTPQVVTDSNGQVAWQAEYTPFGEVTEKISTVEQNLRFPGQYFDAETGLHYNYFRDYDPSTGRYVESDPIGLGGGLSTYGYANGNALLYIDDTGEAAFAAPLVVPLGQLVIDVLTVGIGLFALTHNPGKNSDSDQCDIDDREDDFCERRRQSLLVWKTHIIDASALIGSMDVDMKNERIKFNRAVADHNKLCRNHQVLPISRSR